MPDEKEYSIGFVSRMLNMSVQKKEQQEHYRRLCGRSYCTDYLDYICVNEIGERLKPNTLSDGFKRILEQNSLRVIRLHDLRHPYVKHTTKNRFFTDFWGIKKET